MLCLFSLGKFGDWNEAVLTIIFGQQVKGRTVPVKKKEKNHIQESEQVFRGFQTMLMIIEMLLI